MTTRAGAHRDPLETARAAFRQAEAEAAAVDLSWISPPPGSSDWPLAPEALRLLMALARAVDARHVVELGSGLSTRALARVLSVSGSGRSVSSIDHDPDFGASARRAYEAAPAAGVRVRFQIAPVVMRDCGGELLPVYAVNPARLASRRPADLVLIDGPPERLGGRQGTLYQLMPFMRPGTIALLDDAGRAHERGILQAWEQDFGAAIEILSRSESLKGMAAVLVREPVLPARLFDHRAALTARDVLAAVPPDAALALVDDGTWGPALLPGRKVHGFIERGGEYWGPPGSDEEAVLELAALRGRGVRFLVLAWPSFWWLDHYPRFAAELRERAACVVSSSRLRLFDLAAKP